MLRQFLAIRKKVLPAYKSSSFALAFLEKPSIRFHYFSSLHTLNLNWNRWPFFVLSTHISKLLPFFKKQSTQSRGIYTSKESIIFPQPYFQKEVILPRFNFLWLIKTSSGEESMDFPPLALGRITFYSL